MKRAKEPKFPRRVVLGTGYPWVAASVTISPSDDPGPKATAIGLSTKLRRGEDVQLKLRVAAGEVLNYRCRLVLERVDKE